MSENIVFLRSNKFFGDQIVAFPVLYKLKQTWPDKQLLVIAQDDVAQYYAPLPWIDKFIHARTFYKMFRAVNKRPHLIMALHHSSERYSLIAALKHCKIRLGFQNNRLLDFFWTHSCKKDINQYIGLANLNILSRYCMFDLPQAMTSCFKAIAALSPQKTPTSDVVMMPGGGAGEFKRWGIENYVLLAAKLKVLLGPSTTFSFVLGPAEQHESDYLYTLNRPDFNLIVSQPYSEITRQILHSQLVVANDCGPSHLAQGCAVPYVGLFNEPNPEWFWSRAKSIDITPDNGSSEIKSISLERVFTACKKVLYSAD